MGSATADSVSSLPCSLARASFSSSVLCLHTVLQIFRFSKLKMLWRYSMTETGGISNKDELEGIAEDSEEIKNNDETIESFEESEIEESESLEENGEESPIEEEILLEITDGDIIENNLDETDNNLIESEYNEEENEEENISLPEEIAEEAEDDFSEFDQEESLLDMDEAVEAISEEVNTEKNVGFFGRLVRTLSFGRKD